MPKINSRYCITKREIRNWKTIRVLIPFIELCTVCIVEEGLELALRPQPPACRSLYLLSAQSPTWEPSSWGSPPSSTVSPPPPLEQQHTFSVSPPPNTRPAPDSDDVFTTLPGPPPYVLASAPVRLKQLHRGRRLKHSGVSPSFLQTFLFVYNLEKSGQIIQNFLHNLHLYSCRTDRNNNFLISNNSFYF